MDGLPTWVVTIAAVAVGLSPGHAILSARSIARLIWHMIGPRPEVAPEPRREVFPSAEDDYEKFAHGRRSDCGVAAPLCSSLGKIRCYKSGSCRNAFPQFFGEPRATRGRRLIVDCQTVGDLPNRLVRCGSSEGYIMVPRRMGTMCQYVPNSAPLVEFRIDDQRRQPRLDGRPTESSGKGALGLSEIDSPAVSFRVHRKVYRTQHRTMLIRLTPKATSGSMAVERKPPYLPLWRATACRSPAHSPSSSVSFPTRRPALHI
jgi:hypothetical protein